jgi:hypothetical protein
VIVCHHQLTALDIPGDLSPTIITFQRERLLLTKMHTGGGDNGKRALAQLTAARSVGNTTARDSSHDVYHLY